MRYRHWKNWAENGQVAFVTTTALDFAHVFRRPEMRERMSALILGDFERYHAPLYAFVVMTHHVHLVVQCPTERTIAWLIQRIKSNSAKLLLPSLTLHEAREFDQQRGLNRKSFWKYSFRSVVVDDEKTFHQKIDYTHLNPVKAGLCERAEDYRWSSARLYQTGRLAYESGLKLSECLAEFDSCATVAGANGLGTGRTEA